LAADDPALHVVARDIDGADRGVGRVLGGVAVDGGRQNAAGFLLADRLDLLFVLLDARRDLVGQLAIDALQEQLLGFIARQARDFAQLVGLLLDERLGVL